MPSGLRSTLALTGGALALVVLAGCSISGEASVSTSSEGGGENAGPGPVPAVAGFDAGEIPPVPMISIPDLSMLDASLAGAAISVSDKLGERPGLTVTPAHCDSSGAVLDGPRAGLPYGDSLITGEDGSGTFSLNGVDVVVGGDGSGVYDDGETSIVVGGDGSGTYEDEDASLVIAGDGSATFEGDGERIVVGGDGSGTYERDGVSIVNSGDGAGSYDDGELSIINDGDGTALVNGTEVAADPLAPVPDVARFPSMGSLAPVETCGVVITLQDGVLFDFARADLRPEALATLGEVAGAVGDAGATSITVSGHTDAIGGEDENLELSQRRAESVQQALEEAGVGAAIDVVGLGETRSVAPDAIDGVDNPAGRQLNRRVEIFVPAG